MKSRSRISSHQVLRQAVLHVQSRPLARRPTSVSADAMSEPTLPSVAMDEARSREIARLAEQEKVLEALAEDARAKGFESGRREGFARGTEEAHGEVRRQLLEYAKRFEQVLASVHAARSAQVQAVEDDMLNLLVECLGRLLAEQLVTRDTVRAQLRQALELYMSEGITNVRLSPEDQAWLHADPVMAEILARCAQSGPIRCVPDPAVSIGGCVIETGAGAIDARLDTQLELIKQQLLQVRRMRRAEV